MGNKVSIYRMMPSNQFSRNVFYSLSLSASLPLSISIPRPTLHSPSLSLSPSLPLSISYLSMLCRSTTESSAELLEVWIQSAGGCSTAGKAYSRYRTWFQEKCSPWHFFSDWIPLYLSLSLSIFVYSSCVFRCSFSFLSCAWHCLQCRSEFSTLPLTVWSNTIVFHYYSLTKIPCKRDPVMGNKVSIYRMMPSNQFSRNVFYSL